MSDQSHAPPNPAAAPAGIKREALETARAAAAAARLIPDLESSTLLSAHRSRRDQLTRRLLAVGDAAAILIALAAAILLAGQRSDALELLAWAVVTLPAWILLFKVYKLYDCYTTRISHTAVDDLPWLSHSLLVGALAFWGLSKLLPVETITLLEGAIFGVGALAAIVVARSLMSRAARRLLGAESVLFAGSSPRMHTLLGKVNLHPEYGLTPIAMLDGSRADHHEGNGNGDVPASAAGLRSYASTVKFEALASELRPERVIIDRNSFETDEVIAVIDTCRRLSIKVSILPDAVESLGPSVEIDAVEGVTLLGVNPPVLGRTSRAIKRAFDLTIAGALLLVLAIPMLAIALAIKLDTPGPVLFAQRRVGRGGRTFRLFKFRTMVADAESHADELMAQSRDPNWLDLEDDPRVTRVGRFLRRNSFDEVPQLLNVISGEMSLVGPRPLPEAEDRRVNGYARGRLDLTPGISGLWQVLGRTVIPFDEMIKLDYMYVTNWSLWLDIRLMLQTLPAVLGRRGVN
jgi:exopolysaccharide biosynthesis polyprenyl glycosylphosphotransferase